MGTFFGLLNSAFLHHIWWFCFSVSLNDSWNMRYPALSHLSRIGKIVLSSPDFERLETMWHHNYVKWIPFNQYQNCDHLLYKGFFLCLHVLNIFRIIQNLCYYPGFQQKHFMNVLAAENHFRKICIPLYKDLWVSRQYNRL